MSVFQLWVHSDRNCWDSREERRFPNSITRVCGCVCESLLETLTDPHHTHSNLEPGGVPVFSLVGTHTHNKRKAGCVCACQHLINPITTKIHKIWQTDRRQSVFVCEWVCVCYISQSGCECVCVCVCEWVLNCRNNSLRSTQECELFL